MQARIGSDNSGASTRGRTSPNPATSPWPQDVGDGQARLNVLYPLTQLPSRDWMPRKRGRPISFSTVLRWALRGKATVRLQTLMVGGCRCTCDAWAMEFFRRLTADMALPQPPPSPTANPGRRLAQVEQRLEEAGL